MNRLRWELRVFFSKWRNRTRYLFAAPRVFRNWWAWPLPKLGIGVVLETRRGMRFLVRSGTTDLSTLNEALVLRPYLCSDLIELREDSVVVDVGANIGDFSIEVAALCPRGRIVAIEPVIESAAMIEINKLLNELTNIEVVQVALGSSETEVEIKLAGNASSLYWKKGRQVQKVRQTNLSRLMDERRIGHIDLLKLDCEGAEWEILPNSSEVLPQISQICMEFHPMNGWTGDKLATYLRNAGYKVEFTQGGWNGTLWATRTSKGEGSTRSDSA
jgi:FkbM family methyltransferase